MKTATANSALEHGLLIELITEIKELKSLIQEKEELHINRDWIPWKRVKQFFDYGDTQMLELESNYHLTVARVGRRKFVHRSSIQQLLEKATTS